MKKAGDLLSAFFDENLLKEARGYSELFSAWKSLVGDKIAAHSRIAELDKSILLVEADHPGWIQILQTKQSIILENARRRFPELSIVGISFRLARDESLGFPRESKKEEKTDTETPDSVRQISNVPPPAPGDDPYARISDPTFKEVLMRLEKSIASKNRTR